MPTDTSGIHHVTAIASDPQQNVDFYTGVLGLRLVKLTVNFDDPGAYHLYYGDAVGHPGTLLTFFAWPGAPKGRQGTGQVAITAFCIPPGALDYWVERLNGRGIAVEGPTPRFGAQGGEQVLAVTDPDGPLLELVAHPTAQERPGWQRGPVPAEQAIRGLHGVTLWEDGYEVLSGAILFHAHVPLEPQEAPTLVGVPVFLTDGRADPIVRLAETERLAVLLREAGADVTLRWQPNGHTLSPQEVDEARGMVIVIAPLTTTVMNAVERRHAGVASGVNNAVARTAGLLAVAVLGIVVTAWFAQNLAGRLDALSVAPVVRHAIEGQRSRLAGIVIPSDVAPAARAQLKSAVVESFVGSFRVAMLIGAGLAVASAVSAAVLVGGTTEQAETEEVRQPTQT